MHPAQLYLCFENSLLKFPPVVSTHSNCDTVGGIELSGGRQVDSVSLSCWNTLAGKSKITLLSLEGWSLEA